MLTNAMTVSFNLKMNWAICAQLVLFKETTPSIAIEIFK